MIKAESEVAEHSNDSNDANKNSEVQA